MGIYKSEDIVAWRDVDGKIICTECGGESDEAIPYTEDEFEEGDVVICDVCNKRIQQPLNHGLVHQSKSGDHSRPPVGNLTEKFSWPFR